MTHSQRIVRLGALITTVVLLAGCGASRAFGRAESAARAGDWDAAVEQYRLAVQEEPDRTDYRIALERAMLTAATQHLDQARILEARNQLEEALREYRRASEYDPSNRQVAAKVIEMERRLRDLAEAAQPSPTVQQLQQAARQTQLPLLNPASREPTDWVFNNASLSDILTTMGELAGINVTFERDFQDRTYSVALRGATFEEALNHILSSNLYFYKVINPNTIMVILDNAQKRALYEEQVIRTFFISHADPTEIAAVLNGIIRVPVPAIAPQIVPNKTNGTITVRSTANLMPIIERIIQQNDTARAEVIVDVQILEVNRARAKEFGIDLSEFAISGVFSPETDPRTTGADNGATVLGPRPFNLNTITRGVSTADFYLSVPSAVVRFLEADAQTRLIAKPQLRGAEGQQITLNLGDQIPIPATVFTPLAQGGANFNPLTSINYRDVGVNVQMTPRVTFEGDIILDIGVENSTLGQDVIIAGQAFPSFGSRRVTTRLRLRDGESNLLAGLLREEDRRAMRGIPGLLRLPILRSLLAANDTDVRQTDIIMLLTPRIVRTQELSVDDVSPIFIGTQQNLGIGGPPPLIAPVGGDAVPSVTPVPAVPPAVPAPAAPPPGGGINIVPPGSGPIPGTTTVPPGPTPVPPPLVAPPGAGGAAAPAAPPPGGIPGAAPQPSGQVLLSPPTGDFMVGGGPYTVPVSIAGTPQVSNITLTITFNPAALRVRSVQEGSFMRSGGLVATFSQQVDAASGRVDIVIVRAGDTTGVAGTGLLAVVLFDAVGGGPANLQVSGTALSPRGTAVPLQFVPPATVTVR